MTYTIKNEYYTVTVSEVGAELISVKASSGKELLWQSPKESFWSKHSPLLFPVCGRLKDGKYTYSGKSYEMGAHGFVSKMKFSPIFESESAITLSVSANEQTLSVYPFIFSFSAKYELIKDKLLCSVTVNNCDSKLMPFMFGWHPGFALPTDSGADIEDYRLEFSPKTEKASWTPLQNVCFARPYAEDYALTNGAYVLNEKEIYGIDTMIFTDVPNRARLCSDKSGYSIELEWSKNLPVLCIWKEPSSEAKFICIEPWSDSIGDGETDENFETRAMHRLKAGESETFTYSFKLC